MNLCIPKLVGERAVAYFPCMVRELDSLPACVLMCQLSWIAGSLKKKIGESFYKTAKELEEETALSMRIQDTARKILVDKGWLKITRNGVPAKLYYCITEEYVNWCCDKNENGATHENAQLDLHRHENAQLDIRKTHNKIYAKRITITKSTTNKPSNKTSLSVCEQTDDVVFLVEAEKCLPKNQISKEQLMSRWNELAEKYCFKPHRIFNTAWEKYLAKANKMIGNFHKEGWEEFFRCVEEIMIAHQGMECVRYFNLGFALRPEKFQNILEENVSYPKIYDTDVIKRIIAGLKGKQEKLAVQIRHFETKGDEKMMMKKHKRWKTNREAINKWQEILIGESK